MIIPAERYWPSCLLAKPQSKSSRGKTAQWRPCRIEARALKDVADWMGEYRKFREESFDRFDAYLKTITREKKGKKNGPKK